MIKARVGNFESTEPDVTISNGKQYNNFSYCFYFLLLWLRGICIILFLSYTVYSTRGAYLSSDAFPGAFQRCRKNFILRRIHSRANITSTTGFIGNVQAGMYTKQFIPSRDQGFVKEFDKSRGREFKKSDVDVDAQRSEICGSPRSQECATIRNLRESRKKSKSIRTLEKRGKNRISLSSLSIRTFSIISTRKMRFILLHFRPEVLKRLLLNLFYLLSS